MDLPKITLLRVILLVLLYYIYTQKGLETTVLVAVVIYFVARYYQVELFCGCMEPFVPTE